MKKNIKLYAYLLIVGLNTAGIMLAPVEAETRRASEPEQTEQERRAEEKAKKETQEEQNKVDRQQKLKEAQEKEAKAQKANATKQQDMTPGQSNMPDESIISTNLPIEAEPQAQTEARPQTQAEQAATNEREAEKALANNNYWDDPSNWDENKAENMTAREAQEQITAATDVVEVIKDLTIDGMNNRDVNQIDQALKNVQTSAQDNRSNFQKAIDKLQKLLSTLLDKIATSAKDMSSAARDTIKAQIDLAKAKLEEFKTKIKEEEQKSTMQKALDVLGLSDTATVAEITKAYRKEAKAHHPDKGGDAERMKKINNAYETLKEELNFN